MKVYIVWDNDDYGSMMHPSHDEIDSIYLDKGKAHDRKDVLNAGRKTWRTKARVQDFEVRE